MKSIRIFSLVFIIGFYSTVICAKEFSGAIHVVSSKNNNFDAGGISASITGGMSLNDYVGLEGFSIEGEYFKSIIAPNVVESQDFAFGELEIQSDLNYWGAGAYGAYAFPVTSKISLKVKAGIIHISSTVNDTVSICEGLCSNPGDSSSQSASSKLALGASASYSLSSKLNVIATYTKVESFTHLGLGILIRVGI